MYISSGTVTISNTDIYRNEAVYVCARYMNLLGHTPPLPNAPRWGACFYEFVVISQGGGVYVNYGTVTFDNSDIYGNQAYGVGKPRPNAIPMPPMK